MKRTMFVLCALMLVFHLVADTWSDGTHTWSYSTSGTQVTITGLSPAEGAIVIPETIAGYSVISIGGGAFYGCSGLTSVLIPNSVTNIGDEAFENCSGLTSVTIPDGVTSIGRWAFYRCSGLMSVTIPDSVTSIELGAFVYCGGLTNLIIGSSVTNIGSGAFCGCSGLTGVTIPNSVTNIGDNAFKYCGGLTNVTIPNSVTSIRDQTFQCCSGLTSVRLPNGLTDIGRYAFSDCNSLIGMTIPHSVTNIGDYAFQNCRGVTNLMIGSKVTNIGRNAFYGCNGLASVMIPASVTSIGESAFEGSSGLMSVYITDLEAWCGISFGKYPFSPHNLYLNDLLVTDIEIPDNVTNINSFAFYDCTGIRSVTLPNSVRNIGGFVFSGCSSLTNLTIPNSMTSIPDYMSCDCSSLTSVTILTGVSRIGNFAFSGCSSLASVTIPNSVTSIGYGAFSGCTDLLFDTTTIPGVKLVDGWAVGTTGTLSGGVDLTGVRGIGSEAFFRCIGLTSVTIPNGVTHIGDRAFLSCSSLTNVVLQNCLTDIGSAFMDSVSITKIHQNVVSKAARAATCTEDGWTHEVKCDRCNTVLEVSTVLPNLGGHVEVETKSARAATCTEKGWSHEVKCSRCNTVLEASVTISALGHLQQTTVTAIEPTCTTEGRTAEVVCTRCNTIQEETMVVPALGHARQATISVIDPSCTEDGRTAKVVCTRCGVTLETSEVVPALGHSGAITKPAVEPTSSTAGKTAEITCTRCGLVLQAQTTIPALGYIRNVTAHQLWPHRKIALRYELADDIYEVATSSTLPTVKGTYGSTTKTASAAKLHGDKSCTPGVHHVVWDVEGDSITHTQSAMNFSVAYSSVSASTTGVWVALSSSIKDGMSINGAKKSLWYSPFVNGEVQLLIDGNEFLSSTNLDVFAWLPQSTGSHTLVHKSGSYTWTRTLNVTSLVWDMPPAPNPPTAADANIAIGSTSKAFGMSGGSGTITTSGSGTWTATVSDDWITIPSSLTSRNAGLPVVYQVAANNGVEERTGYIYVSGHVFTITQAGVGAALDAYEAAFETEGGTGSFTVLADAQTTWKVKSNVDWISVTTDAGGGVATQGTGESSVYFTVAPWNEVSTRIGTITAAGCTFTVNQTGRRMKLSGPTIESHVSGLMSNYDYQSHVIAITVNALASTEWDVEADVPWLSVVDAGTGQSGGSVSIAVNENPSWLARSGKVRIGTEWLTINQAGRPSAALDFTISPTASSASVKGANALITVLATPDLPWTAVSQANWLTVMPTFAEGTGNGNVAYSVSPNTTMTNRSGTIKVSAETSAALPVKLHTVTQPGATAMISADSHIFDAAGETFEVDVTCDDIVNWTIAENISWFSIVGSTSRIGPGRVALVASENLTVNPREANVTIAGHVFHVVQKGRTVEVEYESRVFGTESDYATIDVHPDGNVTWTAVSSDPSWITIWGDEGCDYDAYGNVIGTGDHTIEYIVADYVGDGTPRTGTITIGDKTVYITQRAYDLSINPSATTVGGNAGAGTVGVPATVGQIWNALATEPWITIESGYDSGTGSGTVRFTFTDNDTGEVRSGRIIIAGETYTITQAARQMVAISATVRCDGALAVGIPGMVSGTGVYDRGTNVTLTAVANDGYEFTGWTLPNGTSAGGAQLVVPADVDKALVANFRRIPVYSVNGEGVREGTSKTFTAPADVIDAAGTTKLVCRGTSRYPDKGTNFTLVVTEDIDFEWDLWTTNYLVKAYIATAETSSGESFSNVVLRYTGWAASGASYGLRLTLASGKSLYRWFVSPVGNAVTSMPSSSTNFSYRVLKGPISIYSIVGIFNDTLATALDAPALTFTTGGDASWLPVIDATAQTGFTSARSGVIGPESETWLETTVEGAGTLSFRWRVDCEKDDGGGATWDRLAVFTNGVEAARIDGKTGWQTVAINCDPPGAVAQEHDPPAGGKTVIRWSFYRDDWDEPGQEHENAAWVDGIIFTGREGE